MLRQIIFSFTLLLSSLTFGLNDTTSPLDEDITPVAKYGYIKIVSSVPDLDTSKIGNDLVAIHTAFGGSAVLTLGTPIKVFAGENCLRSTIKKKVGTESNPAGGMQVQLNHCGLQVLENKTLEVEVGAFRFDRSFIEQYTYDFGPEIQFSACLTQSGINCGSKELMKLRSQLDEVLFLSPALADVIVEYAAHGTDTLWLEEKTSQRFPLSTSSSVQVLKLALPELRAELTLEIEPSKYPTPYLTDKLRSHQGKSFLRSVGVYSKSKSYITKDVLLSETTHLIKFLAVPKTSYFLAANGLAKELVVTPKAALYEKVPAINFHEISEENKTGVCTLTALKATNQKDTKLVPVENFTSLHYWNWSPKLPLSPILPQPNQEYFNAGSSLHVLSGYTYRAQVWAQDDQKNVKLIHDQEVKL